MTEPDYFLLSELRALPNMGDTAKFTDARCLVAAAYVVGVIERVVGTSFIGRTIVETYDGAGTSELVLNSPYVLSVTSAVEGGVTITDSLSAFGGVLERRGAGASWPGIFAAGSRNLVVTVVAGYSSTPPADIKEAALQATRYRLLSVDARSGLSDRATSLTNEYGNVNLSTAGADRPFGLPEPDAVVIGWRDRLDVMGFA